jgi:hypothetical protein
MDAAPLGSALQNNPRPPMQAHAAEAGSQQPGMQQVVHRRPSTPSPEQGFTVYDNQLAAGAEASEQIVYPSSAAVQGEAPSLDSRVSIHPHL